MFERRYINTLLERISEPAKFIQIVTGPRQAGKTTLVEQLVKKIDVPCHFVSADAIAAGSQEWINQQWETARTRISTRGFGYSLLIIDEIQKIENWPEAIKKNWDTDRRNKVDLRVILLGSSSLLIQKGLSESLMGRFEQIILPHWSYSEMNKAFGYTPEQYVWFGAYPGAASIIRDEKRWKDYIINSIVEPAISKDVVSLTNIHKPALLRNLFELSCTYTGQILSYTKLLGKLTDAGNTTTLKHYQNLLDEVWLVAGLDKYSGSDVVIKSSIPKWVVYNSAFASVFSGTRFPEAANNNQLWGRHVETAIGSYLLNESRINNWNLYYWRDGNMEVDFIVSDGNRIISIEVKLGTVKVHSGIEYFNRKYETHKTLLISAETITWKEFLQMDLERMFQ